jgi:hypothetical protein
MNLCNASDNETSFDQLNNLIEVLEHVNQLQSVGYKSIVARHGDANDSLSEHKSLLEIRNKALYHAYAYKEARNEMPFKHGRGNQRGLGRNGKKAWNKSCGREGGLMRRSLARTTSSKLGTKDSMGSIQKDTSLLTKLQTNGREMGMLVDRTPKCHCKLAGEGIEYSCLGMC